MVDVTGVRAVIFDVFGTLVDWRTSVARQVGVLAPDVDGAAFADAWRAGYQPAMEEVRSGRREYVDLDVLHREILNQIVGGFGLGHLTDEQRHWLTMGWHELDPWPDVADGLARLRHSRLIAPCSNGHIGLVVDLSRHNDWRWDAVLGAELAGNYKTTPSVYLRAAAALGCSPDRVMMVACHSWDLAAAAAVGMRTAHVARPDEKGPGGGESSPSVPVDVAVESLSGLADRLGC